MSTLESSEVRWSDSCNNLQMSLVFQHVFFTPGNSLANSGKYQTELQESWSGIQSGTCSRALLVFWRVLFREHCFLSWLCHCLRPWSVAGCFSSLCLSFLSPPLFHYLDCKSIKTRTFCRAGGSVSDTITTNWCIALQVKIFMLLVTSKSCPEWWK